MFDKQMIKGIVANLTVLSNEEKEDRVKKLQKHLAAEMKRRKMKPTKK